MEWEPDNDPPRLKFAKCPSYTGDASCGSDVPMAINDYETITVRATDGGSVKSSPRTFKIHITDPCVSGDSLE